MAFSRVGRWSRVMFGLSSPDEFLVICNYTCSSFNDPSLSNTLSCNRLHINYHGIVCEVHKKCMKLQTSSRSKPNERDIILLHIKINSNRAPDMAATPESNL